MTSATRADPVAGDDDAAIRTWGLTKRYGDRIAVRSLDLRIPAGEVFGLLGPNGAGKTTTILMLLGLSEPSGGRMRVVGLDPARQPLEVKRRVGYVPDDVGFYGSLSGRENLRYTAALNGLPARAADARVDELLDEVGLTDRADDRVRAYSRGMRQRLGIADALVKDPEVLILDEPTIGLDPQGADQVLDLVRRLASERGVAVLLTSHLLGQVQAVCGRIGIFASGSMVASGSVEELSAAHADDWAIEVGLPADDGDADLVAELHGLPGVRHVGRQPAEHEGTGVAASWLVAADRDVRSPLVRRLQRAGVTPVHLRRRAEDLADIYRSYFTEEARDERRGRG